MLSTRVPLAALQEQPRLSPLKNLALSDKENTVSALPFSLLPFLLPLARYDGDLTAPAPLSSQPPALNSSRVLASKTARKIFRESEEKPVSARGPAPPAATLP